MDRFDAMRVFARIVERRSFTQAADDLGLPRSSVTDAVKGLEARLGGRLNADVIFSSPPLLPRGFPVRPLRNWFAFGGLPYPTSQGESVALELGFFIACSSSLLG